MSTLPLSLDEENVERLLVKQQELRLRRQRLELRKKFGLAFYNPHPKQDAFHRAGITYKRRMARAGNRFGKSTLGCTEDAAWMLGERPWYPESDPARKGGLPQRPVKILVITTDWSKVDEVFTSQRGDGEGKLWKFLPSGYVKAARRGANGVINVIEGTNGSIIRFDTVRSWLNDPQGTESSDWDAIHIDEPCPQGMWKSASRGLMDRDGSAWFTLTPLSEFWINDMFFPEELGGQARENVWSITGSTYDNPTLSKEAIAEFERDLTDEEKQCRLHGIPLHLSGLVYKQFSRDVHVLKTPPAGWNGWEPPAHYCHYFYIDPHPQTPHCVNFVAVGPDQRRYYYRDLFEHCSIEALGRKIREVLKGKRVIRGRIDPIAYVNDPITETNMAEELARFGVYVEKATKAREQGTLRVQGELAKRDIHGICPVQFTPEAKRSLWEIQRYCWDEKENKPIDENDHAMENLYRAELDDPKWYEPAKDSPIGELVIDRPDMELEAMDYLSI
jgi:hypothetical protein